jgi:phosphatidylglycerophosphate synthase
VTNENSSQLEAARDRDIAEFTNAYFIHPLSDKLAVFLQPLKVHPNWVSAAGLLAGLIAALFYLDPCSGEYVAAGFGFMVIWHIMDGADGHLARLTNESSTVGKIVDGIADYSVFGLVYAALAYASYDSIGNLGWIMAIAAAASHALQAASYEHQRETYIGWIHGPRDQKTGSEPNAPNLILSSADFLDRAYLRTQQATETSKDTLQSADYLKDCSEADAQIIRQQYKERFAPQVRLWSMLSANVHTIAIFMFTLFGGPWSYFIFEIIGLNLLLVMLRLHQKQVNYSFAHWLERRPGAGPGTNMRPDA